MGDEDEYTPIQRYGLVGDCHGAALISDLGDVDWCCLGRFDSDPVFFSLLDPERGGRFSIHIPNRTARNRWYVPRTNILVTEIETDTGVLRVTDCMPVGRAAEAGVHDYVNLNAPYWLMRRFACVEGRCPLTLRYRPSISWAQEAPILFVNEEGIGAKNAPWLCSDMEFVLEGAEAVAEAELAAGEHRYAIVSVEPVMVNDVPATIEELLEITRRFWTEWARYCRYRGPHAEQVVRSALTLKALTYAPTGAIVAAPTTSLPECPGDERNWDYRYCWLRDASLTLSALSALGYSGEGRRYSDYLKWCLAVSDPYVQIMYGIGGETSLEEIELDHLAGYRQSRPVRVGNAAYEQIQLDVYGHLFEWARTYKRLGGRLGSRVKTYLRSVADHVARVWDTADNGIWEMRTDPRHHIFGKMLCWVALDRANHVFGKKAAWLRGQREIENFVLDAGLVPQTGALRNSTQTDATNAALLLSLPYAYPLDTSVYARTLERVREELGIGPLVRRYKVEDGLPGREGAFVACSFWLVDALLFLGEIGKAEELFDELVSRTNDLGLLSEQIDPESGDFLGNFPQGLSHIALIHNAHHFDLLRRFGAKGLQGGHADRAKRAVGATFGVRAILQAVRQTRRASRIFSSEKSKLDRFW